MSIARALAVLGAGSTGYMAGQEDSRQRKRQDEDDAFRRETRERQRTDWTRADKEYTEQQAEKEGIRKAAAPVEGAPVYATGDDEGNAMPPVEQKFTVPGQQAPVDAAGVAALNTPSARMGRAAGAVRDPMKAAQMMNTAQQSELGGLQLDEARQQAYARTWDRKIGDAIIGTDPKKLSDPAAIAQALTDNKADGKDGATKWAHKVDGKTFWIYPTGPDGTALNQGFQVPDTMEGRIRFAAFLSKGTSLAQKLADVRADEKAKTDRDDKDTDNGRLAKAQAEIERHNKAMELLQAESAKGQRALLGIQIAQMKLTKAAAEAEAKIPPAVKMAYSTIDKEMASINAAMLKAQADDSFKADSPNAQSLMVRLRELQKQSKDLISPYIGGKAAPGGDELGLFRDDKPATTQPTKAAVRKADPTTRTAASPSQTGMQVAAAGATGDRVMNAIEDKRKAEVVQLHQAVIAAKQQLAAVARSGDAQSAALYARKVQEVTAARDAFAAQNMGNAAPAFLATLPE